MSLILSRLEIASLTSCVCCSSMNLAARERNFLKKYESTSHDRTPCSLCNRIQSKGVTYAWHSLTVSLNLSPIQGHKLVFCSTSNRWGDEMVKLRPYTVIDTHLRNNVASERGTKNNQSIRRVRLCHWSPFALNP